MSLALLLILFSHLRFWPIVCRSVKQSKYLSQRRVMVMTKCYFWSAWIITSVSTLSLHVQNKVEWTIPLPVYHNPFFNIEETYVYFQIPGAGSIRIAYILNSLMCAQNQRVTRTRMRVGSVQSWCLVGLCWMHILTNGTWKQNTLCRKFWTHFSFFLNAFSLHINNCCL